MSKEKSGLKREKGLKVVKDAGFKRHKRKQLEAVSENSRAGIHGKNQNVEGVEKVKRKKPLALKHRRRMIKAAVALSAVFITALSVFGYGFFFGEKIFEAEGEYYTVSYAVPTDGTTPLDHSDGIENIGYMNYVLHEQQWWSSTMHSDISIKAVGLNITQTVDTTKQYYNEVLISTDITTSSMVNSARQYCVISNPPVVLWRDSASSKPSTFNGVDTEWYNGEPQGLTQKEFRKKRGCIQDEFSVYIINPDTVLDYSEVTDNGDGTFSQTFHLNPSDEPGENSSIYYYRYQMQASGGLTALPTFNYVTITYTFDSNWRVIRSYIDESYVAQMGLINAAGVASSITEYSYEEADARNSFYDDYFKKYKDNFAEPEEEELTAASCLSAAFGSILTGEAKLAVDFDINGKPLSGLVQLNLDESDVRVSLGNIRAYMLPGDENLYLSYGNNVKVKIPLSSLSTSEGAVGSSLALDTDELVSQLADGEFTVSEDNTSAKLASDVELFGLKIPLTFNFNIAEGEVSLNNVSAVISVPGADIGVELKFTEKGVEALSAADAAEYAEADVAGITNLISAEALKVGLAYSGYGVDITGDIYININEFALNANLRVVLDGAEDGAKLVIITYIDGTAYLSVGSEGQTPAKLKAEADKLTEVIKRLAGADNSSGSADILDILADLLPETELGDLLYLLLADNNFANNFAISGDGGVTLTVDGTAVASAFGAELALGELTAKINDGKVSVSALGLSATLEKSQPFAFDKEDYADALDLVAVVESIENILADNGITVRGLVTVTAGDVQVELDITNLSIGWGDGEIALWLEATLTFGGVDHKIYVSYNSTGAAFVYDNAGVKLENTQEGGASGYRQFIEAFERLYKAISAEADLPGLSSLDGLLEQLGSGLNSTDIDINDIFGIINSMIITNGNGAIAVQYEGVTATVTGKTSEGVLGLALSYDNDGVSASGAVAYIGGYSVGELPSEPEVGYLDLAEIIPLLDDITEIIINKGLTVGGTMTIATGSDEVAVTIYGLSVGWADGIELQLDARLVVNGSNHDIYAEYSAVTGDLKIVYGALDGGTGIDINVTEDVTTLEGALVALYKRIADVANTVANGQVLPEIADLSELLNLLSVGGNAVSGVAEVVETLDGIANGISIADMLNSIQMSVQEGKFIVDIEGLALMLWRAEECFNMSVQTSGVGFEMNNLQIVATEATDFNIEVANALSAEDIADLLDYIGATVELLVSDTFDIKLTGTVASTEKAYAEIENNVKYNIDAGFEYVQGESGYPVHVDTETPDFWIAPDIYVHVYVNMQSTLTEVDSVLFDIYIFNGNPEIGSDGKTTETGLTADDNELDIYMSLSRIPAEQANNDIAHEPLKIYAPMSEIMNVLSAGLAIADVGSISIDALPGLNGIITKIGEILDGMLVDRYLGGTKGQFSALGSSLLGLILGGSISDLLNDLIGGLTGSVTPEVEQEAAAVAYASNLDEGFGRERQGLVNLGLVREDGNSELTLSVGETYTTVTKQNGRLTNLNIDTVELKETDTLNNLNIDINYEGVERVTSLKGYTSLVGADSLVKALVNSVTHEVPEEERTEENPAAYALNNSFFIDGEISLGLGSWDAVTIYIDGLYVGFDEEGELEVNLRMHYSGFGIILVGSLIEGSSTVYLTVKGGMVYMKRVQTRSGGGLLSSGTDIPDITIYRAMTLDAFMDDIAEQMIFLFNFGSLIADSIREGGGATEEGSDAKKDYGTQLAEYFNWLTFTENTEAGTAQWKAQISGTGLSELAGITLGDITATFNAVSQESGYVINSLGINGSLTYGISFAVGATLNWQNPQEVWRSDAAQAAAEDLAASNPAVRLGEWLGGTTLEDIKQHTDWDNMLETAGMSYFELATVKPNTSADGTDNVLEDNITSTVKLCRKDYYYRTSIYGQEEEYITSIYILYIGEIEYTIYTAPEINDYQRAHCTVEWSIQASGNIVKYTAVYTPDKYMVHFHSEHAVPDFGTEWSYKHSYGTVLDFDFLTELRGGKDDIWYRVDYILCNGKWYTAENIDELEITGKTEIEVVWKEIPHATVAVVSSNPIEGFDEVDGKWSKDFEIEVGADVNLAEVVGTIADYGDYVFGGFTLEAGAEETSDYVHIDGETTVYVMWKSPVINVIYYSSLQLEDYDEAENVEGYTVAYSTSATYNATTGFGASAPVFDGYYFLGWYYNDPVNGWTLVNDVKNDISGSDKYSNPVELHALWAQATIEGSGTYTSRSAALFWTYYTSTMKASISLELFGNSDLASKACLSSATFTFNITNNPSASSGELNDDGSISVEGVTGGEATSRPSSASVTVTFQIAIDGNTVGRSWSQTKSGLSITAA